MIIGVDIGGTKTLVAVFSDTGSILRERRFSTPKKYEDFIQSLGEVVEKLELKNTEAVCVAVPGLLDRKAGVVKALGNLEWQEKQGRRVNVGGILRFLLGVLIVIAVAYLLVRFINSRRANNDAEQATQQTSQNEDDNKTNDSSSSDSGSATSDSSESETNNDTSETQIPSGFADSDSSNETESDSSQTVPAAGMGDSVIYIALVSGLITFGAYELANLRKKSTDK